MSSENESVRRRLIDFVGGVFKNHIGETVTRSSDGTSFVVKFVAPDHVRFEDARLVARHEDLADGDVEFSSDERSNILMRVRLTKTESGETGKETETETETKNIYVRTLSKMSVPSHLRETTNALTERLSRVFPSHAETPCISCDDYHVEVSLKLKRDARVRFHDLVAVDDELASSSSLSLHCSEGHLLVVVDLPVESKRSRRA